MEAAEARNHIERLVERTTGFPVHVSEDASLPTLGTMKPARESLPYHVVRYSPSARDALDYVISFQCGFVMRLVGVPPERRYEVGASPKGNAEAMRLVGGQFGGHGPVQLTRERRSALAAQLLGGLITQLRSIPLALRIDKWLRNEYPGLRTQQDMACHRQLKEGVAVLAPSVRNSMPKRITEASIAMNAAQALFWSEQWEDSKTIAPYKAVGLLEKARVLRGLLEKIPGDPIHDPELIDAWGQELGIQDWYVLVPFGEGG